MKSAFLGLAASAAVSFGILSIHAQPVAAEPVRYEAAYVFGDSLSDPGNLFALTQALTGTGEPGFPYFQGRISNGPIWADHLAHDFTSRGLTFRNYAFAFARVVSPSEPVAGQPATQLPINLNDQLGRFLLETLAGVPARSAALVWMGANDSFRIISDAASQFAEDGDMFAVTEGAVLAAESVADQLLVSLSVLVPAGVRDLVLFDLPDLGRIPNYAGTDAAPLATNVSTAFNARLAMGSVDGLNLRRFDVAGLFDALLDAPEAFGVSSSEPCFVTSPFPMLCDDPNDRAFFDLFHPSATIHARLADEVRMIVAPIPLPAAGWLLLAGLAGLGAVRMRRRG